MISVAEMMMLRWMSSKITKYIYVKKWDNGDNLRIVPILDKMRENCIKIILACT